jgi:hypothetical protein
VTSDTRSIDHIEVRPEYLHELFAKFITIPAYQREFDWTAKQGLSLFEDAYRDLVETKNGLFLNTLIVIPNGELNLECSVIDGQQRLTTSYLLLAACRDVIRSLDQSHAAVGILNQYLVGTFNGKPVYRIVSQHAAANAVLSAIAAGKECSPGAKPAVRYQDMHRLLARKVMDRFGEDVDAIAAFARDFLDHTKFAVIDAPEDRAVEIFLRTNDRGMGLNALDKLRARLFDGLATAAARKTFFSEFNKFQELVWASGESPNRLVLHLAAALQPDAQAGLEASLDVLSKSGASDPIAFVRTQLLPAMQAYSHIVAGCRPDGTDCPALLDIAKLARLQKFKGFRPVLVAGRSLPTADFDVLADATRDLLWVLSIAGSHPPTNEMHFRQSTSRLKRGDLAGALAGIQEHKRKHGPAFWLNHRNMTYADLGDRGVRFVLGRCEQRIRSLTGAALSGRSAIDDFRDCDIEHILPQSPRVTTGFLAPGSSIVRLGNLTLLERALNRSVKNMPYGVKRADYENSNVFLTRSMTTSIAGGGKNNGFVRADQMLEQFPAWDDDALAQRESMLNRILADALGVDDPIAVAAVTGPASSPGRLEINQARPANCSEVLLALGAGAKTRDELSDYLQGKKSLGVSERNAGYVTEMLHILGLVDGDEESKYSLTDYGHETVDGFTVEELNQRLANVFLAHVQSHPQLREVMDAPTSERVSLLSKHTGRAATTCSHIASALVRWEEFCSEHEGLRAVAVEAD